MNLSSLSTLPADLKLTFARLLEHAYKIDHRTQDLVLSLIKVISKFAHNESDESVDRSNETSQRGLNVSNEIHKDSDVPPNDGLECHHDWQPALQQSFSKSLHSNHSPVSSPNMSDPIGTQLHPVSVGTPVGNINQLTSSSTSHKMNNESVEGVIKKLTRNTTEKDDVQSGPEALYKKTKARMDALKTNSIASDIASLRQPLSDISNDVKGGSHDIVKTARFASHQDSDKDVILLDNNDNCFVQDYVSPLQRFHSQKSSPGSEDGTPVQTQHTPVVMYTLLDSPENTPRITPNVTQKANVVSAKRNSIQDRLSASARRKVSPDVVITGERTLCDTGREMSNKSEGLSNDQLCKNQGGALPFIPSSRKNVASSSHSVPTIQGTGSGFKSRDSSSGGKLPPHGSRRLIFLAAPLRGEFVIEKPSFNVSKSEIQHYNAICRLSGSQWQTEYAVDIFGVKCTYWSLGDSLKPGGVVNTFVVAVFCYHLFSKLNGHPDISKKHFYFPNIGENLLKDPDDANQDVLARSFRLSRKARPLHQSNMLFFPIFFNNHWFVFVVDIKDHLFVFLDPYYKEYDEYQTYVRERLTTSFQIHWDKYVKHDMKFDEYQKVYPVPEIGDDNIIKIANELLFLPNNVGNKLLTINYYTENPEED